MSEMRILLATVLLAFVSLEVAAQPVQLVGVDRVRAEPLSQTIPVIGRMVPRRAGDVAARVSAPVEQMLVEVGARVEAGDLLAVLVANRLQAERDLRAAEVSQAQAAMGTANAEIGLRRQELQRLEGLRASAAFSRGQFDDKRQEVLMAEGEMAEADAAVASARAELRLAEIDLNRAEVRAPYAGVVTRRHTEAGAYVNVGNPIVTLVDDRTLEVEADVPANRTSGLNPGLALRASLDTYQIEARVRAVVPQENVRTRTQTVRLTPLLPDGLAFAANQSVTIYVPAGQPRTVISVHKDAVINRQGETLVVLVVDGTATMRTVRLGEAVGGRFEVVDGLAAGDVAVVRGNERLRPGQSVRFLEAEQG